MNKSAIIRTQLIQQLKYIGLFMIFYVFFLGAAVGIENYTTLERSFDGISYLFMIFLIVIAWVSFLTNITLYSYHSFNRKTIFNRTVIVQLIVSLLSSLLIEAHNFLVTKIPFFTFIEPDDSVRVVYANQLTSNVGLQYVISILFMTLVIFGVLLLADLVLVLTYAIKRRNLLIILFVLFALVVGVLLSIPYWSKGMLSLMIKVLGFLTGTGQSLVPSIVVPSVLVLLVGLLSYFLGLRKVKKLEVHKNVFI
ncbi:hypothetical protein P7H60_13040 [Vagococcus carniphilus]|uniref:hypothetical protein n=1 Tax=Vagococcus carniphilus TaxID=218144 RepID=UPI00288C957C|nr:hypothetical protein [Vagococcus carniphilus]MDT2850072.1 hypothetical protein [Vagococcus carniphilus]MDT2863755.1 hypothetical protein [Vagococcus carniphilus]